MWNVYVSELVRKVSIFSKATKKIACCFYLLLFAFVALLSQVIYYAKTKKDCKNGL